MADDADKTPPMSDEEMSGSEDEGSYDEADTEHVDVDVDVSQELTVEDATEFAVEETEEELCDYEMLQGIDDSLDETQTTDDSHIVYNSTIHTTGYITKYEKARVLGWRSQQIKSGAAPMLREDEKDANNNLIFKDGKYPREPYDIAQKELEHGRCPVIIGRRMPNGEKILVRVSQLKLI